MNISFPRILKEKLFTLFIQPTSGDEILKYFLFPQIFSDKKM